jgi:hypothetical protein
MSPVMIVMGTGWWFLLEWTGLSSWLMFLVMGGAYVLIYVVLAYFFMMNSYERNLLIGPVKIILSKFKKRN